MYNVLPFMLECADQDDKPARKEQQDKDNSNQMWIIGAVLGPLAAVIIALVICFCVVKP